MEDIFALINKWTDFDIIMYMPTDNGGDFFYLMEQSSLQVLQLLPPETPLKVVSIFSERQRIAKRTDEILAAKSVGDFFRIVLPLVENGSFPCKDLEVILDEQIEMSSHDDGEVHLKSLNKGLIRQIVINTLRREEYDESILQMVIDSPNVYHKLERPGKIIASFKTFDEVIGAM